LLLLETDETDFLDAFEADFLDADLPYLIAFLAAAAFLACFLAVEL
jgi:hypothetical protein